ncbi:outer membrane lipid asymmetry maintenance protein MlaD [Piscirickettsia litoralis]|uniref:Outer membrane lipid asymmetry maintenance protein MlaD n=1 Tax=Piscirickettsia litoralis TaxID=1891921 RepID=A0ABX3A4C8_9GAMM|nr:outer membrane lipid asymmetry maintenance protein MlaD [Piscirickettsia litoralis]ODN42503.1 outer membrane lipid asymmetry maintenance protein MlaD [Piscirickettsia litoralis]
MNKWLETWVGLFVLLGIAGLFILVLQISGIQFADFGQKNYDVNATFSTVGDLKKGAPVRIAGVLVGKVAGIKLDPVTYQAKVTFQIQGNIKNIPDDSSASVRSAGILGDNYVMISPGYSEHYLANGGKITTTYPPVGLDSLISNFVGGKVKKITR